MSNEDIPAPASSVLVAAETTAVQPPEPAPEPEPARLIFKLGHADVVDYHLARRLLYELEFRCRRQPGEDGGDFLFVWAPGPVWKGLYAKPTEAETGDALGCLFVDEGSYSDALRYDMTVGYNEPWTELVDMTSLLGILARHFEPSFPVEPSPYIGRGRSQQHYLVQHIRALVEGDQSKHPRVRFVR